jgi:hypothetical protein
LRRLWSIRWGYGDGDDVVNVLVVEYMCVSQHANVNETYYLCQWSVGSLENNLDILQAPPNDILSPW